ncbi:MAG: hypothetical protein FJ027_06765 [Candidatus Rokubacteria bacterium]|nr:hypothetical protein [Candidatus Rokubacteria bacterium]
MIEIRAIWEREQPPPAGLQDSVHELTEVTARALHHQNRALVAAGQIHGEIVDRIKPIAESAGVDLVASCELARCGYFKQAYALWRAWFEQAILALYFLEAPLHLAAWKTSEDIRPGIEPETKLMLHQLLVVGGPRAHHFSTVYRERCEAVLRAWRVTPARRADALVVATSRLSDFSQGVHGTFRPPPISGDPELSPGVARHALPVLMSAARVVSFLWFVNIQSHLDLSDEQLVGMRTRGFVPGEGTDEAILFPLLDHLEDWLVEMRRAEAR